MSLKELYRPSLGLLTDLYQVTMAYGYWKEDRHLWPSVFHWTVRRLPFGGGFAIACGLQSLVELLEACRFEEQDLEYLAHLEGNDGRPLFEAGFLDALAQLELDCDIDAAPEGSAVFAREPLVRVSGPLWVCQLLETPLLNQLNFQTLIATKSARVCHLAAAGDRVVEFGLRRAQGADGAVIAARAAYVGGCAGTSNLLAGRLHGIPVLGTHAHSWVLSFDEEIASFRSFAASQPNNCTLLVDTYDTRRGVDRAIEVGLEMAARGQRLAGIRLDSGDLLELSQMARERLDRAGLVEVQIVASGDLDEHRILELRDRGAKIDIWGVGTRLTTGHPDAALAGVYKLGAIRRDSSESWRPLGKLSEEPKKSTLPGALGVRRYRSEHGRLLGDAVYGLELGPPQLTPDRAAPGSSCTLIDRASGEEVELAAIASEADLLEPLVRGGRPVAATEVEDSRQRVAREIAGLPPDVARLDGPVSALVGVELELSQLAKRLANRRRAQ